MKKVLMIILNKKNKKKNKNSLIYNKIWIKQKNENYHKNKKVLYHFNKKMNKIKIKMFLLINQII